MRVVFVNLWRSGADPETCVAQDDLRRELGRALAARGHEVTVVQELERAAELQDGPVRWIFVPPAPSTRMIRAVLTAAGRDDAMVKAPAGHVYEPVARLRPEVIHSFDLASYPMLLGLGRVAERCGASLVAHFHGGAPAVNSPLRLIERRALARTQRLLFTTRDRGQSWVASGALPDASKIVEIFESSSTFSPGDRGPARGPGGLLGKPALLHVGRLDPVKDPMTTLRGFRALLRREPTAHLSFAWTGGALEAELRAAAEGLPVSFLGRVPKSAMEELYRSADVLLQASVREVCGYAVLESLATGTPPVLSDIPSFRRLTDGGRVGRLFVPGDPNGLAEAVGSLLAARRAGQLGPADVRRWFDQALSFPVLAASVERVYEICRQETRSMGGPTSRQGPASHSSSSA